MKILSQDIQMETAHLLQQGKSIKSELFEQYLNTQTAMIEKEDDLSDETEQLKSESLDQVFHLSASSSDNLHKMINDIMNQIGDGLKGRDEELSSNRFKIGETFNVNQTYYEEESYSFLSKGVVNTDSGSFDFSTEFSLSRSFMISEQLSTTQSFDPLVINVAGSVPQLQDETFSFDLNNDSKNENIALLKEGSGFLALDKNGDGIINRGSELFGTLSGDGFSELARYDEDKNHWIDASDSIFDDLKIWFKNSSDTTQHLDSLQTHNIGAIYLNSEKGEFHYKNAENQTLGTIQSSSLFLKESGGVGNVVQINLNAQDTRSPLEKILQA